MNRFWYLLKHEFKQARATLPIHLVAIVEPALMYLLMTYILVQPLMTVYINPSGMIAGQELVEAMEQIGSPIGERYIKPVLTDLNQPEDVRQVIVINQRASGVVAIQKFNLIDSNLLKNYRNRLTAAAIRLWDENLKGKAVDMIEMPTMPVDIPYNVYFGMTMLPLAVFLSASIVGAALTAQEFETNTVLEYRLAPISAWLILAVRLFRLILTALIAAGLLLVTIGLRNGYWPDSLFAVILVLLPLTLIAGSLGISAGLFTRHTLPAFIISLVASFFCWIIGSAFKPAVAIGGWYESLSRLMPTTYIVERLFPHFYGVQIGSATIAALALFITCVLIVILMLLLYQKRIYTQE